ncbi:MAG: class I SAM-dependent methyltransferase [Candidatus Binatia bacterium]
MPHDLRGRRRWAQVMPVRRLPAVCVEMDYTAVTEVPEGRVTSEALAMMYTRYVYAASLCAGKEVLEVACGAGQGLGYLASKAGRVVGGDYTQGLLRQARRHYGLRMPLVRLDAHALPFVGQSFDVVILFEAIYYLARPEKFLDECRRVLRGEGLVLICTVNKEWSDFSPSPLSSRYVTTVELRELMAGRGFKIELYAAFPVSRDSARDRIASFIKRAAIRLHLIPETMKGKEILKRFFFGTLAPIPAEITDGMAEAYPCVPITGNSVMSDYKVLYVIGRTQ